MKLQAKKANKQNRWSLTVAWIVLMMILSLAVTVTAATDLTNTVAVSGLTVNSTGATDWTGSANGAGWTGSTTGSTCNGFTPKTGKLVLTNDSGEDKVLSFNYTLTLDSGTVKIAGASVTTNSSYKQSLAAGASVTIEVSSRSGAKGTTTVNLTNIKLEVPSVTVKFETTSNGSYTLDGATVTASTSLTKPATQKYTLVATPAEHYVFQGWYLDGNLCYTGEKWESAAFPSGGTITAQFTEDPLYKVVIAVGAAKDDLVEINSRYFHDPNNVLNTAQNHGILTNCYYSVAATTLTANDWDAQHVPYLAWSVSGTDGITASRKGTAQGDYYPGGGVLGGNSWCYANMVANVIRIKAKEDCTISFDYTNSISPTNDEQPTAQPYLWIYESSSDNETIATIQSKGTLSNTTSGSIDQALAKGKYLYICISGKAMDSYWVSAAGGYGLKDFSYSATISGFTISLNEQKGTQTTIFQDNTGNSLTGGQLKVGETTYTAAADGSITPIALPAGAAMKLSVVKAPANYRLLGWSVNGTMHYSPTYEYVLGTDTTAVNPIFVPDAVTYNTTAGTYQYKNTDGTLVTLDGQYIARNTAATLYYSSLELAFQENNEVVLLGNMTIEGNYEISSGKTLMVPRSMTGAPIWDSTNKWYTPTIDAAGRSVYATLTTKGNLTVSGKLVVDGGQNKANGSVYGPYGVMDVQGTVTVNNGAEVYAYGVIKGAGTIQAQLGAKIHELMEILDMPHPITANNITNKAGSMRLFPFNSIYVYSIEAPVVYHKGAVLYGHHSSSYTAQGTFAFIGDTNAIFLIHAGTITKSFKDGRMLIRINENSTVYTGSMKETMEGSFSGVAQDITVDTADYLLPLSSGYHIQVAGNLVMNHSFKLLPGAKVDIQSSGTMTISEGADLVLYRLNDYDYRKPYSVNETPVAAGFSVVGYPINFSCYSSGFSIENVGSAKLNVDGMLTVKGGLYVTDQLMPVTEDNKYIHYNNGYNILTGFGTIDMTNATTDLKKISENLAYSQSTDVQEQTVNVVPIKGLKHDATADDAAQYSSLSGVMYGVINDNGLNVWDTETCRFRETLDEGTAAKAPTCLDTGSIAYWTCTRCGKMFSDAEATTEITAGQITLPATGHTEVIDAAVAPTCTETGLTEGCHCSACGEIITAQTVVATLAHNYNFKTRIVLGESLDVQFAVSACWFHNCGEDGCSAAITRPIAGTNSVASIIINSVEWTTVRIDGRQYYVVTLSDISAKEMTDKITLAIWNDNEQLTVEDTKVASYTDSIREYVLRVLPTCDDTAKTMLVDLLYYGAAAQEYYGYGLDKLANAGLESYAHTTTEPTKSDTSTFEVNENYTHPKKISISAATSFSRLELTNGFYLHVSFVGIHKNMTAVATVGGNTYPLRMGSDGTMLYFTTQEIVPLTMKDANTVVKFEIYDEGVLVCTINDSIASYVAKMHSGATGTNRTDLDVLLDQIVMFSASVQQYVEPWTASKEG